MKRNRHTRRARNKARRGLAAHTTSEGTIRFDSLEVTRAKKPRFDAYACGHGVHGDVRYNRRKEKREFRRELAMER